MSEIPGVATVSAQEAPKRIAASIRSQVAKALLDVPAGRTMAVVSIQTGAGVNLALAHKFNNHWTAELYLGKSGWDQPVQGGALVTFSR